MKQVKILVNKMRTPKLRIFRCTQSVKPMVPIDTEGVCRKNLVERIGKGYLYRNLGRTKKDVVGNWPEAHANVEAILNGAQVSAEKSAELIKRKDHRATILHLVEEE